MSGGVVADWITPEGLGGQGGMNEYNANICCDLNGVGNGDIQNPQTIPDSSSTAAAAAGSSATPVVVPSSSAAVVSAPSSSSTAGSVLQMAAAVTNSNPNYVPGLGEVHVYRLYPGPRTQVTPGSVPGMPQLMTVPGDVVPPEGRMIPAINNDKSSDNMLHGVQFKQVQQQQQQQQLPTPVAAASSPAINPAGMIAPAIDPSLQLTPDQLNAIMGNPGAGLVHPALSPVPLSQGLVPPAYSDAGALLQRREQQGTEEGTLTADQLWVLLREQDQKRMNPQPVKPMTPSEMLKVELDVLRQQMKH